MTDPIWYCPPGYKAERWADRSEVTKALSWTRKPRAVLAGDIFRWPDADLDVAFAVMALCPQHLFVVLTTHPEDAEQYLTGTIDGTYVAGRIADATWEMAPDLSKLPQMPGIGSCGPKYGPSAATEQTRFLTAWPLPNVQLGVPVSTQGEADERIPQILGTPAAHRFVYVTPREAIDLRDLSVKRPHGIEQWDALDRFDAAGAEPGSPKTVLNRVIVGGGKEPVHPDHVRLLRDQCIAAGVPFFFDGWGEWIPSADNLGDHGAMLLSDHLLDHVPVRMLGHGALALPVRRVGCLKSGRLLDGQTWEQWG